MKTPQKASLNGWLVPTVNLTHLKEVSRNNKKFIQKICNIFKTETPVLIENLGNAIKQSDKEKVSEINNQIKHHFKMMGITEQGQLFEKLDNMPEISINHITMGYLLQVKEIWQSAAAELEHTGY